MEKRGLFMILPAVAICSLVLAGCGNKELEQAKFEAAQAELEHANTQRLLARTQK